MGRLKGQLVALVGHFQGIDSRPWVWGFSRYGEIPDPDKFVRFTHDELQAVARLMVCIAAMEFEHDYPHGAIEAALFGDAWYVNDKRIA